MSEIGNQSLSSLLRKLNILTSNGGNISLFGRRLEGELMPIIGNIFSPKLYPVTNYYLEKGCATVYILRKRLTLSSRSAYRYNQELAEIGFINPVSEVPKTGLMKRPAVVWGIEGCTSEESIQAVELHLGMIMPKREVARKIAIDLYKELVADEVRLPEIRSYVRSTGVSQPQSVSQVSEQVAKFLHMKGVKVWR